MITDMEAYTAYDLEEPSPDNAPPAVEPSADDTARTEIENMMQDMGADKLLDIIRNNRNAAIEEIKRELTENSNECLPSGISATGRCDTIFDLAALA